jgi:chitinase
VQGKYYAKGDIVKYTDGLSYIALNANPGYNPVISTWYWGKYNCTSTSTTTSTSGTGFMLTEAQFNQMFPARNAFYTYAGLVAATKAYPAIFNTGSETVKRQELAAFLANVDHETGGLQYVREINTANYNSYCASSSQYPCASGQQYYGRGPLQLSWNYNYGAAGAALGLNLLADPDLVARDATVAWKTAMWFWMTQTGAGTMTAHNAMSNQAGFGETIRTINGALECNKPSGTTGNTQMQMRMKYYSDFTGLFGVPMGNNVGC